jgi:starch phosphorylase
VRYSNAYQPTPLEERSPELAEVFKAIQAGTFGDGHVYDPVLKTVYDNDYYLVSNDFGSYLAAEKLVDELWQDQEEWTKKSIRTAFAMGDFSSDRSIQDYADSIWSLEPDPVPDN